MYTKISLVTASIVSVPIIQAFLQSNQLARIFISPEAKVLEEALTPLAGKEKIISAVTGDLSDVSFDQDELLIAVGFPHKVKVADHISALNVHFGMLPENRGPDPVFWTLRKGNKLAYISIHELTNKFDAGAILLEQSHEVFPGENYGFLSSRLAGMSIPLIQSLLQSMPEPKVQSEEDAIYHPRPKPSDYLINWETMPSWEVERIVNASNPKYGGAITKMLGAELRIIEVVPVDFKLQQNIETKPGSIVHANPQDGIVVSCQDQRCLLLRVVSLNEGIFSGQKLAAIGLQTGMVLG